MSKNDFVYLIHAMTVVVTAIFAAMAGIASWYFILIIGLPLLMTKIQRLQNLAYALNVRILFPISVGLLFVVFYHYLPNLLHNGANSYAEPSSLQTGRISRAFFEVNPVFKDAVSVLFAISTAFLLWKGLTDFDELKNVLYREACEVRILADYTTFFLVSGDPERNRLVVRRIRELLRSYLYNILDGNQATARGKNEPVLKECLLQIGHLAAVDANDRVALEEIMKGHSRLSLLRAQRTACIEKKMPPFLLGLMLLMSLTMVASMLGNATGEFGIDYAYVFLLPAFYAAIFMTLIDLSSPFDGYWAIKLEAVRGVIKKLDEYLGSDDTNVGVDDMPLPDGAQQTAVS